jgi:hypothetical protein
MKVSQIIEAKNVTNVYYGWSNELQLTVEGGQINLKLNEVSLRDIAKVLNGKIADQDEEAREKLKEEQEVE